MIKVSIIIPVYNVEKYIIRCLDSVINQTYTDIECILVDDCSPDNSIALVEERLKEYRGTIDFKILCHEQNKGLSAARNTGTYASTGEYIYYLDSDDEITPHCIGTLIALVEKYPGVEMVQGNTQTIPAPAKESDWRNIKYKNYPEYVNDNAWIKKIESIPVNAWNKLTKRDFIVCNKYIFKEGIIHEDELWMFYVVKKLKTIAFSVQYTYIHYLTEGSIMQSKDKYPSIYSWYSILTEIFDDNGGLNKKCKRKYLYVLAHNLSLIDFTTQRKYLYLCYKLLLKRLMRKEWREDKSFVIPILYLLYMPGCILRSYVGRKMNSALLYITKYSKH
jgi:glycosyltransferase involved in cell wall biosynthesis